MVDIREVLYARVCVCVCVCVCACVRAIRQRIGSNNQNLKEHMLDNLYINYNR